MSENNKQPAADCTEVPTAASTEDPKTTQESTVQQVMSPEQREEEEERIIKKRMTRVEGISKYLAIITPKQKWEDSSKVRGWASAWKMAMTRFKTANMVKLSELEVENRYQVITAILDSITDDDARINKGDELVELFIDTESANIDNLLDWFDKVGHNDGNARTSELLEWIELREKIPSFQRQQVIQKLGKSIKKTFKITDSELSFTEWMYRGYKRTEVWGQFLQYFAPFTDAGRELSMPNIGKFFADPIRKDVYEKLEKPIAPSTEKVHKKPRPEKKTGSEMPLEKRFEYKPKSYTCGKLGHRKGDPQCSGNAANSVFETKCKSQDETVLTTDIKDPGNEVILDSVASVHVFNHKKWFTHLEDCDANVNTIAGRAPAQGRGTVKLPLITENGDTEYWELKNCLYLPNKFNLVSKKRLVGDEVMRETFWVNSVFDDSFFAYRSSADSEYVNLHLGQGSTGCDILPVNYVAIGQSDSAHAVETSTEPVNDISGPADEVNSDTTNDYFVGMVGTSRLHTEDE